MKAPKKTQFGDYATWVDFEVMGNYHVRLIFTDDLLKSAKGRIGSTPGIEADAFCFHVKNEPRSYIFLEHKSTECTVAHECYHIVAKVLEYCGVQDFDSEVVAYHLDHLVEKVYDFKKAVKSSMEKEAKNGHKSGSKSGSKPKTASKSRNR